jgi:hypothetical protein
VVGGGGMSLSKRSYFPLHFPLKMTPGWRPSADRPPICKTTPPFGKNVMR